MEAKYYKRDMLDDIVYVMRVKDFETTLVVLYFGKLRAQISMYAENISIGPMIDKEATENDFNEAWNTAIEIIGKED